MQCACPLHIYICVHSESVFNTIVQNRSKSGQGFRNVRKTLTNNRWLRESIITDDENIGKVTWRSCEKKLVNTGAYLGFEGYRGCVRKNFDLESHFL